VIEGVLGVCDAIPGRLRALLADWSDADRPEAEPALLARAIGDRSPVFLGAGAVAEVVATRARNQVAENAERPAMAAALPEACHNQLVGWAGTGTRGVCDLVVLRPAEEIPAATRRVEAAIELASPGFAEVHQHRLPAGDVIERIAAGFLFVDLLSVHLALQARVDPTPIVAIEELKGRL
jgi:glucose/mannose-6-phosphate isomerase